MVAYKFRSSKQICFALDIIAKNRLHCSDWRKLNDPTEGWFLPLNGNGEKIMNEKSLLRVCSLSLSCKSHLMWSHYAQGFNGMVLAVRIPDIGNSEVRIVKYTNKLIRPSKPEDAIEILSSKFKVWRYEKEVRIICKDEYFDLSGKVEKVIVGPRLDQKIHETLRRVCDEKDIPFCKACINDNGRIAIFKT